MGNTEFRAEFKDQFKESGKQKELDLQLTPDIIQDEQLLKIIIQIQSEIGGKNLEKAADKIEMVSNLQNNENEEETFKRQFLSFLNDNYLAGLSNAESNVEFLKEPNFEKYFTVTNDESLQKFKKIQLQKLVLLYSIFIDKFKDFQQDTKSNFFEFLKRFLEKSDIDSRIQVGLECGLKFSLSLLKQIGSMNKDMLVESLEYLYQTIIATTPGSLYRTDKLSFIIDASLNESRQFLQKIIEDPNSNHRAVELSYKIILSLGIMRSNVEDLMIVVNLLEKHNHSVDLRHEIQKLTVLNSSNASLGIGKSVQFSRQMIRYAFSFFMATENGGSEFSKNASMASDGNYLYFHQEKIGLVKLSNGSKGQIFGNLILWNKEYRKDQNVTLLYLNDKLYCRSNKIKPRPFVTINPMTLEEEKEEIEIDKGEKSLEWKKSQETGRFLTHTPMFTEGKYIYVVSQRKPTEQEREQGKEKILLAVECYDPAQSYSFVKEIFLFKNAEREPFYKESNSKNFIRESTFATDGQTLLLHTEERSYYFDMNTGIKISKDTNKRDNQKIDYRRSKVTFDYKTNIFYAFRVKEGLMISFTISNFKSSSSGGSGSSNLYLRDRIKDIDETLYGNQKKENESSTSLDQLNVIEQLMMNGSTTDIIQSQNVLTVNSNQIENLPKLQRFLILNHISNAGQECEAKIEEIKSAKKSQSEIEKVILEIFKFPNSTFLSCTLFQQLQGNLEKTQYLIDSTKSEKNLLDQYTLLFTLKILKTNFSALNFCSISLPQIMKGAQYDSFLKTYQECVMKMVENGYTQDFEEGLQTEEIRSLWLEIYAECFIILSVAINHISADTQHIIDSLEQALSSGKDEKALDNCSIQLNFISMPQNARKLLLVDSNQHDMIKNLYLKCLDLQGTNLRNEIKKNTLSNQKRGFKSSLIVDASQGFLKEISDQLITQYSILSEKLSSSEQVSASQLKDLFEKDKTTLQNYENLIQIFFEAQSNEIVKTFQCLGETFTTELTQVPDDQWAKTSEQYEKMSEYLLSIITSNSAIFQTVALYVETFKIAKLRVHLMPCFTYCIGNIFEACSNYKNSMQRFYEKLEASIKDDKLRGYLEAFTMNLSWFLGNMAYKLIQVKSVDKSKKEEEDKPVQMEDLLVQSNFLSGGIENRYISTFSTETINELQELIKISNDQHLLELMKQNPVQNMEDKILQAIIHSGKHQFVDTIIGCLQSFLERKIPMVPYARLAGQDGLRMTRAAFAVMIKFSDYLESFECLSDEIEMEWQSLEGDKERDLKIKEMVKNSSQYENIFKRWESASKMRQWINQKKQTIMEKIKIEVEDGYVKNKVESMKKQAAEQQLEQIDTLTHSKSLNDNDRNTIEEIADEKLNQELQSIFSKIVEKAEFLIKLYVPAIYLVKDVEKKQEGGKLLLIKDLASSRMEEENKEESDNQQKQEWITRLKTWKKVQTSKGAISSYTDKKKEIFDSSVMSVLACLQTSINAQKIQKQVETIFLNASKRIAGLKILSHLINLDFSPAIRNDLLSWFCSSLRGNTNNLSHYLDDLKGCGIHLEGQARIHFFNILKGIIHTLKHSKDESEIKSLLNALKWKFFARDHASLKNLEIFKVLNEGNGEKDNLIKRAWGKPLKQVLTSEKDKQLSKSIIEFFDQIFLVTVGRIIKPDTGDHIKLQSSGPQLLTIEKAQSMINENASERLIGQAFEIMFKEFERYIKILQKYQGVTQTIYQKMKEEKKEFPSDKLLDEDEEEKLPENVEEAKELTPEEEEQKTQERFNDIEKKTQEKQMKSVFQLYNEQFLKRILRLVEIFTSVATTNPYPKSMVHKVASSYHIETLLNLLIISSPRIKLIVAKILQNLVKMHAPVDIFEDAIKNMTAKNGETESYVTQILSKIIPSVDFEDSKYLKFIYHYILSVRHKMWEKSGIESEGQYAVSQELCEIFRIIMNEGSKNSFFFRLVDSKLKFVLLNLNKLNLEEVDLWLEFLPGCQFLGIRPGQTAITNTQQSVIVLGFSKNYKIIDQAASISKSDLETISLTMKYQDKSKVVCLYNSSTVNEIIVVEPGQLTPVVETPNLHIFDDKDVQNELVTFLQDEDSIDYKEKIKRETVKCSVLKVLQDQIQKRGQEFLEIMHQNGVLEKFIDYTFMKSSKPFDINQSQKLPETYMEMKAYSLRQKALETNECLCPYSKLTATMSNSKYIAFKNINGQENNSVLYPISVSINVQPNIKTTGLKVTLDTEVMDTNQYLEIVLITPQLLQSDQKKAFKLMKSAKITLTSDEIDPQDLLKKMRQEALQNPKEFLELMDKMIIMLDSEDFSQLLDQSQITFDEVPQFDQKAQPIDKICQLLRTWGNCSEDVISFIREQKLTDEISIYQKLNEILDPKTFEQLKEQHKAEEEEKNIENLNKQKKSTQEDPSPNRPKQMVKIEQILLQKNTFSEMDIDDDLDEDFDQEEEEEEPFDLLEKIQFKQQAQNLIDKHFMISDESQKSLKQLGNDKYFDSIQNIVKECNGEQLQREYYVNLTNLNLIKSRKVFVSVLQHGDLDKFLQRIRQSAEHQRQFIHFLKMSFNEAQKSKDINKELVKTIKNIIRSLFKYAEADNTFRALLRLFIDNDLILNSRKLFISRIEKKDVQSISNIYFDSEEDAISYCNPMLFAFVTNILIKDYNEILMKSSSLAANLITLSTAYSIHYGAISTKDQLRFLQIVHDIVHYAFDNQKKLPLTVISNIINNTLLRFLTDKFKIEKNSEKMSEAQRILIDILVMMSNLKNQYEIIKKKQIDQNFEMTRFLLQMHKLDKVIRQTSEGSIEYLSYINTFKKLDKQILEFLTVNISTPDKLFNSPFKIYKKIEQCKRLSITINPKDKKVQFDQLTLSSDAEGKNILKTISLNDKTSIEVYRNDFYLHYPGKAPTLIGFGSQIYGKLGTGHITDVTYPISINLPLTPRATIKEIYARRNYVMILDSQDQIYVTGNIKNMSDNNTFTHKPLPNQVLVKNFSCGKHTILVQGDNDKWYGWGRNKFKHLKEDDCTYDSFTELPGDSMPSSQQKIVQFATGTHFTLFVTEKGKLLGKGSLFLESIGENATKAPTQIKLPLTYFVKTAYVSQSKKKQTCAIIEVIDNEDKHKKFLSAGNNDHGLLGQGTDVVSSTQFKPLDFDHSKTYFTHIEMNFKQAMAINQTGQLYVWGSNEFNKLGLEKMKISHFSPVLNEFFNDQRVKQISIGSTHSLIQTVPASSSMDGDKFVNHIYSVGRPQVEQDQSYHGIKEEQSKIDIALTFMPQLLHQFNDLPVRKIAAGQKSSFIYADSKQDATKHFITNKIREEGIMHFYFTESGDIVKIQQSQYEKSKHKLPDVCFAIKYPITDIEKKQFPNLAPLKESLIDSELGLHEGINCNMTNDEIIGARYYTKSFVTPGVSKSFNFSEESFFKPKDADIDPLIYIRLAKPIDSKVDLPEFKLQDYYTVNEESVGFDIIVKPFFKTDVNQQVINLAITEFQQADKLLSGCTKDKMKLFKDFFNTLNLDVDDCFSRLKSLRDQYKALDSKTDENVQKIIKLTFLPLLDFTDEQYVEMKKIMSKQVYYQARFLNFVRRKNVKSLYSNNIGWSKYMENVKEDMLLYYKNRLIKKMIGNLDSTSEGSVSIKRRKAFYFKNSGQVDHEGKNTIFGQIFQQVKSSNFSQFKKSSVDSKVFNVSFAGEGSQDAGGPFRESITNMCAELQSDCLPILIRTANNKNNHGQFRECWIPNPSSKSPTHKELFKFFGAMIGWAIRSTSALQLDLAPILWKKILNIQPDEQDLKMIDTFSWQVIEDLRKHKTLSKEEFEAVVDEKFVTLLSDGTEAELCQDGRKRQVTQENLDEFINLMIKARLNEFDTQMKCIKEGIHLIIPENILFFMSWSDIELRATGSKTVDIPTLKRITRYESCHDESNIVKMFWNVFEELTDEQRTLYLKFVWGRSRLPLDLDNLDRRHKIEFFSSRRDSLPISHTCFFTIDMPDYSSQEIMKQRLIYAITYCGDIDADRGRYDIADEE